jgi:hypothetical protein
MGLLWALDLFRQPVCSSALRLVCVQLLLLKTGYRFSAKGAETIAGVSEEHVNSVLQIPMPGDGRLSEPQSQAELGMMPSHE